MTCPVCAAPPLPLGAMCPFCRSPLADLSDATGLLDYMAARLPGAEVSRGPLGRGPVRKLVTRHAGQTFSGRLHRGELELSPGLPPANWVNTLLKVLSVEARSDHVVRSALMKAGWDLR